MMNDMKNAFFALMCLFSLFGCSDGGDSFLDKNIDSDSTSIVSVQLLINGSSDDVSLSIGQQVPISLLVNEESGHSFLANLNDVEFEYEGAAFEVLKDNNQLFAKAETRDPVNLVAKYKNHISNNVLVSIDSAEVTMLQLTPSETDLGIGLSSRLTAFAFFTNGLSLELNPDFLEWQVDDRDVVSLKDGVVTGLTLGETYITASYEGLSAKANFKVTNAKLMQIAVALKANASLLPLVSEVPIGTSEELGLLGIFSSGMSYLLEGGEYRTEGTSVERHGERFEAVQEGLSTISASYVSGSEYYSPSNVVSVSSASLSSVS
uniref:hypothetical protein n=1 Tax=Vibrio parahaemolyticus TaxID=670 RepID=UPI001E4C0D31